MEKLETYSINDMQILIEDKSKPPIELKNAIKKAVFITCEKEKLAKNLREIKFIIEIPAQAIGSALGMAFTIAFVSPEEIKAGKNWIHINTNALDILLDISKLSPEETVPALKGTITHELAHIWNYRKSEYFRIQEELQKKLGVQVKKHIIPESTDLESVRNALLAFLQDLLIEGFAEFYTHAAADKIIPFIPQTFAEIYSAALEKAQELADSWNKFIVKQTKCLKKGEKLPIGDLSILFHKFDTAAYGLGMYMYYTILYLTPGMQMDQVAKMNHLKFISAYETCMKDEGYAPLVITLNSGEGILDYNRMIYQWWQLCMEEKARKIVSEFWNELSLNDLRSKLVAEKIPPKIIKKVLGEIKKKMFKQFGLSVSKSTK